MSQENVEIVRLMSVAFKEGDWAAALEPVHPDIEMDTTQAPVPGAKDVYTGREEVAKFWGEWLEAWGAQTYEEELIDAGDKVVLWVSAHELRGRGSGVEVGFPAYAWVLTVRDTKIVRATFYLDKAEALQAAGLSE